MQPKKRAPAVVWHAPFTNASGAPYLGQLWSNPGMNRSLGAAEHLLWRLTKARPVNAVLCASLTEPRR